MKHPPLTTSNVEEFLTTFNVVLCREGEPPTPKLHAALLTIANNLYIDDYFPPQDTANDPLSKARFKDAYAAYQRRNSDTAVKIFIDTLLHALRAFVRNLPAVARSKEESRFSVSLRNLLTHESVEVLCGYFEIIWHRDLFITIRKQLNSNRERIKEKYGSRPYPFEELLRNTHFEKLLDIPIPFSIPRKAFTEHGAVFAKTGHGKTQTLRTIIHSFLKEDDPPALFIVDGNGSLIENIDRLDVFHPEKGRLKDRLVILDPTDTPPALNFFKLGAGSPAKQMELFFYLFKAIEQGLTQRQATMVAYLAELMIAVDGNLDDLRTLCETREFRYVNQLQKLPEITQDFFTRQFHSKDALVNQTKQQIAQRLYTIGRYPRFSQMFNAVENKFDALACMQDKKICLINTDRSGLGDAGSAIFGRFILAQCLAAAFQRPKDKRHLALIICDEAKAYLDDQAQMILSDSRAFGMGLLLATQFPHQLEEGVRREIITNTTIKMMGPVEYAVASQYARDMFTAPDFIMGMRSVDRSHADWATYIANITPQALKLSVPFGAIEKEPMMDAAAHAEVRKRNRERFGATIIRSRKEAEPPAAARKQETPRATSDSPIEYDTDI